MFNSIILYFVGLDIDNLVKNSLVLMVGNKLAPVAQSVSALYLYGSKAPKKCGGCEFEPHLGQKHFLSLS